MVKFEVVQGRKGPYDRLVKVWAYGEVFSFSDLLFLLQHYFDSEDSYYPVSKGFKGRAMLLMAIIEVYTGIPLSRVLKNYKLERKTRKTVVIENLKNEANSISEKPLEKLHEVLVDS
jgi:hypothetical protein